MARPRSTRTVKSSAPIDLTRDLDYADGPPGVAEASMKFVMDVAVSVFEKMLAPVQA